MSARVGWVGGGRKRDLMPIRFPIFSYYIGSQQFFNSVEPRLVHDQSNVEQYLVESGFPEGTFHGEGSMFPWGFDREEMVGSFFRVKQWHFNLDADVSVTVRGDDPEHEFVWQGSYIHFEFDFTHYYTQVTPFPLTTKETDLVRVLSDSDVFILYDTNGTTNPSILRERGVENASASGDLGLGASFRLNFRFYFPSFFGGGYIEESQDYWSNIEVSFFGQNQARTAYSDGSVDPSNSDYMGQFTMLDNSTSIYGFRTTEEYPSDGGDSRLESVSAQLTPKKYWPYANSQGEPVYDEDTGTQLVDPFS